MAYSILVLNGPNLNLLGTREPEIYGTQTIADIESMCQTFASPLGIKADFWQSNNEGELVTWIQDCEKKGAYKGVIINAGAYSHTSIAIADALKSLTIPIIEVHISNIYKREAYRHHSYISGVAKGVICGFGGAGYMLAIQALSQIIV